MAGWCPLPLQGKVEAYGSQSELISQGVDPTHLLGLMKKMKEERDEFAYVEEEEEEEEEEGKGKDLVNSSCTRRATGQEFLHGANFNGLT